MRNNMKALQRYILFIFVIAVAVGCSDDKDETGGIGQKTEVSFTTEVQTRALTSVITSLKDNAAMSVFVTENGSLGAGQQANISKAVCRNGIWKGSPAIEVEAGAKVYLYATYPYQATADKPDAVPVEIETQTDYLYSGTGVAVSYEKPNVQLTMKHALSILAFNIKNENYAGAGKLQQITISGKPVYTSGKLNVSTGIVKGVSGGKYSRTCDAEIRSEGWEENLPDFFCIPFSSSGSDVTLSFKIDGDDYTCHLPKGGIVGGMKYIFYLAMTEQGLTIFPDQTKQISLNVDEDSMSLPGYSLLKITHDNAFFTLPSLKGNGLVGTILWGDGQNEEYGVTTEHTYDGVQTRTVTVETWGTEEVSLPDLAGISEIDLSEF